MRKSFINSSLFVFIFFVFITCGYSQTKEDLQKQKQKTEKNIKLINELLKKTAKTKSTGLNKLLIINKRISLREKLIRGISQEINALDKDIDAKSKKVVRYQKEIKDLKDEYAKMIYYAYKNKNNYDRLIFILSAEDFNQAYRRMKYFQQYSNYRKKQAKQIVIAQKNLEYEIEQLKYSREEKLLLLAKKERENNQLIAEKSQERTEIKRLKRKERELRLKIRKEEKIRRRIKNAIADLIRKETKGKAYKTLSASEELISQGFKKAKGKLSWPIKRGVVLQEFGEHAHPVIKGVKIKNDGIDIGVTTDYQVRSVYEGVVKKIFATPGRNMAIIIRHGHFLSLYSNIVNVQVKTGDVVKAGTYIGDLFGNSNSLLQFRIYEETKVMNPRAWLKKK